MATYRCIIDFPLPFYSKPSTAPLPSRLLWRRPTTLCILLSSLQANNVSVAQTRSNQPPQQTYTNTFVLGSCDTAHNRHNLSPLQHRVSETQWPTLPALPPPIAASPRLVRYVCVFRCYVSVAVACLLSTRFGTVIWKIVY